MSKLCPLKINHYGNFHDCEEDYCAWWDKEFGRCCVMTINKNLDYLGDVAAGTRILFTKEVPDIV